MKKQPVDVKSVVAYYDSISIKPYRRPFLPEGVPETPLPPIESILSLNRDMDPYVRRAASGRTKLFGDPCEVLSFIHLSDVHGVLELWDRMTEFLNHYADILSFALHTGDYCSGSQAEFIDCYAEGIPARRPILNCVGNHDTVDGNGKKTEKKPVHDKLFSHTGDWGVTFMPGPLPTAYRKDFPASNLRLFVLDLYYDQEAEAAWLRDELEQARRDGVHVLTAMHQPTAEIVDSPGVTFQNVTDFRAIADYSEVTPFDGIIADFIRAGGIHVANLAGHYHSDWFGYTKSGVLNVAVACATDWAGWSEGEKVRGTRSFDCFNVTAVDTNVSLLKLVRIGDQVDSSLREKRVLSYDYRAKKVLYNA